ncbi:sugar transporter [Acinetobacter sp. ANC 4558]|uniref:sugar transporter n=1 Tax=Acinetobacter sp. ANC 4558 TaxID=1977876 RepID=UPI000A34E32B|nr:sugar transporter [Acinetobacter sp. ANC 4558]OTG79393.1 sugar transporter [Acinetobacter sp. ANC 4558]
MSSTFPKNAQNTHTQWVGVITLAFAAFIFNTTEFIPIALLSDIGQSFAMPVTQVGTMITIYAWVVALISLPIMLLTKNIERRFLLISLFMVFILSHVLSYFAWSFSILLLSRIGIAIAHALFWSITASLVVRIAPQGKEFQALGLLSTGTVLAMVLGIPFGRMIGDEYGWRNSFGLIAICASIVCLILSKTLPRLPSVNTGSLSSLKILAKRPSLMFVFALVIIVISAQFTAYSYIEPFALNVAHFDSAQITSLLLIYGGAGFIGSYLFGKFARKLNKTLIPLMTSCLAISMLALLLAASSFVNLSILSVFWGVAIIGFSLALQAKTLSLAADATDVAMAIFSGLYNVGIGGGALIGGFVTLHFGLNYIGIVGGVIATLGTVLALYLVNRADFSKVNV